MPVNDNFEVKITATYGSDIMMTVLHYQQIGGTGTITDSLGSLILAVQNQVIPALASIQVLGVRYKSIRVQQVGVANPIIFRKGLNYGGLVDDDGLPPGDAALFVKRANVGGRKNVGKIYVGGTPEGLQNQGTFDVTDASVVAAGATLLGTIEEDDRVFRPIIWHRADSTPEYVVFLEPRTQMSHQKRRHLPVY